jgi:tetratricopeptide (TPR) repeat protein
MRKVIAIAAFAGLLVGANAFAAVLDDLLANGQAEFRAGQFEQAVVNLSAAAEGFQTARMFERYETALVYLALAQARSNRESDTLETIVRLAAAERVEPHYATLTLGPDVADFPALAARLAPAQLPANNSASVTEDTSLPLPVVRPKAMAAPEPQPCDCPTALDLERQLAAQRAADQKAADERVAAVQRAAEERIAALRTASAPQPAPQNVVVRPAITDGSSADSLRRAAELAERGDVAGASDIYERLLMSSSSSRETLVEVATGFYRLGVYDRARYAFDRVGELRRGEEDLRYYKAVSLFETGDYHDARKEIACALPYLEVTNDVAHYSEMIDEMAQASAAHSVILE